MAARHPLPYAYAKAHTLLLEDDGEQLLLWAGETTPPAALAEVTRLFDVAAFEREATPRWASASPRPTLAVKAAQPPSSAKSKAAWTFLA